MANLMRTTVTIPEDLLKLAKIASVNESKTLSEIIREGLEIRVNGKRNLPPSKKELLSLMGMIKPKTPMFKNPSSYIRRLRVESDENRSFSA